MLKRLMGLTKRKPLHLRHEPFFIDSQHQLAPSTDNDQSIDPSMDPSMDRHHPGKKLPALTLEEARRLGNSGLTPDGSDVNQRLTTLDALDQIRENESLRYPELVFADRESAIQPARSRR